MNNSTPHEFPYWKEVSIPVVFFHVTFIYLPSVFLNLTTLFAAVFYQYPIKSAKAVFISIAIPQLLNTLFGGTISLISFTLCLSQDYCILLPVHQMLGILVQYVFVPLMFFWLAILQFSWIKCKGCTCSYLLTISYIVIVAVTTITVYIMAAHFVDSKKLCSSIYEGDLLRKDGPHAAKVASRFVLTFVWTLLMVAVFVLYSFGTICHGQSLTICRYAR